LSACRAQSQFAKCIVNHRTKRLPLIVPANPNRKDDFFVWLKKFFKIISQTAPITRNLQAQTAPALLRLTPHHAPLDYAAPEKKGVALFPKPSTFPTPIRFQLDTTKPETSRQPFTYSRTPSPLHPLTPSPAHPLTRSYACAARKLASAVELK